MYNPEFVKWLAGYFALSDQDNVTKKQLFIINNHLNLVEAVEGALGSFNQEVREIVVSQMDQLDSADDRADKSVIYALKEKVIERANMI